MSDDISEERTKPTQTADSKSIKILNSKGDVLFSHDGASLRGAFLGKAYLRGAQLRGVDLTGAELSDADLRECDLREATLAGVNLTDANLSGGKLRLANLCGTRLKNTNFDGADLAHGDFSGAQIDFDAPPTFRRAVLHCANLANLEFFKATFANADLRRSNLNKASVAHCDLTGADLRAASLEETNMNGVRLDSACLYRVDLSKARNLSPHEGVKESPCFDASTKWPRFSLARLACLNWWTEFGIAFWSGFFGLLPFALLALIFPNSSWVAKSIFVGPLVIAATTLVVRLYCRFGRAATNEEWNFATVGARLVDGGYWDTGRGGTYVSLQRSRSSQEEMQLLWNELFRLHREDCFMELDLSYSGVTDDQLRTIATMKRIDYLNVKCTQVSDRGFTCIRDSHPDCRIEWDFRLGNR